MNCSAPTFPTVRQFILNRKGNKETKGKKELNVQQQRPELLEYATVSGLLVSIGYIVSDCELALA